MLLNQTLKQTPLIKLEKLSKLHHVEIYGKIEAVNPTGSHKDRESREIVAEALKKGYTGVGCASTGNAAISVSAYAYMSGLECDIYVSKSISREKTTLIKMFKPKMHVVDGDYTKAIEVSNREIGEKGLYNANPGRCEAKLRGNAEIGREIAGKLSPTHVICPTNNGTHITGVWMGLKEAGEKPFMVAATAEHSLIADSIYGFHKVEGKAFLEAMKASEGKVVDVSDSEIVEALRLLYREGVVAEPAAAASVAAIQHLSFDSDDVLCCTITGSGMKFPKLIQKIL